MRVTQVLFTGSAVENSGRLPEILHVTVHTCLAMHSLWLHGWRTAGGSRWETEQLCLFPQYYSGPAVGNFTRGPRWVQSQCPLCCSLSLKVPRSSAFFFPPFIIFLCVFYIYCPGFGLYLSKEIGKSILFHLPSSVSASSLAVDVPVRREWCTRMVRCLNPQLLHSLQPAASWNCQILIRMHSLPLLLSGCIHIPCSAHI